jgi:Glyoxalase/Bleomycin resistance protein/Dioxygenase superfamily
MVVDAVWSEPVSEVKFPGCRGKSSDMMSGWVCRRNTSSPTPDKPDISVVDYEFDNTVSTFMNLRVADVQACYEEWRSKGAEFVTPPIDRGAEIRCYMRDPDGYLIEVGQSTGLFKGQLAKKRPEDLPG